jgi:hypothetical protein
MKKVFCFLLAAGIASASSGQSRMMAPVHLREKSAVMENSHSENRFLTHQTLPSTGAFSLYETVVGTTWFDLQTNASMQKRMVIFDDGTAAVTWTKGMTPPMFNDLGTGYGFFNGNFWTGSPNSVLENENAGWPGIDKLGGNGEIVVSHTQNGLFFSIRENKGTGDWNQFKFFGPSGNTSLMYPRLVTSKPDHTTIHLIAQTRPVTQGGALYQGMDGALLYSRSNDGGLTWQPENLLLPEINAGFYNGFRPDTYVLEAGDSIVAFVVGDPWSDLVLMKSEDLGETWTKTIVWTCPFPNWTGGMTDVFYCPDGSHALTIDETGMVHFVFGITRVFKDNLGQTQWFPLVGGIVYWKEGRPVFSSNHYALCPYDHPDSELIPDYNLIAWEQDLNNNGEWDILGEPGIYYLGSTSMPQIFCNDTDQSIYVVFTSVTETYNNGINDFRHIWARRGNFAFEWWGPFYHLSSDLLYIFDELVYPSLALVTGSSLWDPDFYMAFQADNEPGLAVYGAHMFTENRIHCRGPLSVGIPETIHTGTLLSVSQNSPNPFKERSVINVSLSQTADLYLEVVTLTGQKMISRNIGNAKAGVNRITIEQENLRPGIYFYTVRTGSESATKKMIVR